MNNKTVVLISHDPALSNITERILRQSYNVLAFRTIQIAIDYIYNSIPDLLIVDMNQDDLYSVELLNSLKTDPIFHQLPVIIIVPDNKPLPDWESVFAEDYIMNSSFASEGLARANLAVVRSARMSEINPLTRLPGNISINRQIQTRIDQGEIFALAYADLDHFKPFNDHYGFSRGDEVIRIAGRLILNIVKNSQPQGSFVGHIGGDDFVFIMDVALATNAAQEIIDAFDRIIPTVYDSEDRTRGYIETQDRKGVVSRFPLVSISIGIASNQCGDFAHYGQMTGVASEMKGHAKQVYGSCYSVDKRRS